MAWFKIVMQHFLEVYLTIIPRAGIGYEMMDMRCANEAHSAELAIQSRIQQAQME